MTSQDAPKCTCTGPFCTCDGEEVLKDGASFRISMMIRDGSIVRDADPTGRNLSVSEKRKIVARAYDEAAVQKLANEGGKSSDFKEGYAKVTGEQFTQSRSDTFILASTKASWPACRQKKPSTKPSGCFQGA